MKWRLPSEEMPPHIIDDPITNEGVSIKCIVTFVLRNDHFSKHNVGTGRAYDGRWAVDGYRYDPLVVIAWMPAPEPYKK